MIHYTIYFEKYSWEIEVYIIIDDVDINRIMRSLKQMKCQDKVLELAYKNIHNSQDSGFTYTDMEDMKSLMVINKSSNMQEFINTYNHEKNHVEMHICEANNIDPYSEQAAYLSGDLAQRLFLPAVCILFI